MWTKTTLGESCKMYQPKTISAKEMVVDGEYVVFGANGIIGRYDKYNHSEPQLLVTCRGATCGSVNVSEPNSWITGNAMVIQPDTSKISMRFMEYVCRGGIDLSKAITGAAQPQITRKSLEPIEFSYPPLAEQQRIVTKLDAAFTEIDRAANLTNVRESEIEKLRASLLDSLLLSKSKLHNLVKLRDVCQIFNGGTPKSNVKDYWDGDIQWLTPKDMGRLHGKYVNSTERKITTNGLNNSSAKLVPSQSVILSCRAPIGHVFINSVEMSFNQGCKGLVPSSKLDIEYLYYFIYSSKQLLNDLGTGTTFKEISSKTLGDVEMPLPSIDEQRQIVSLLNKGFDEVERILSTTASSINDYAALKGAILKQELSPSEAA